MAHDRFPPRGDAASTTVTVEQLTPPVPAISVSGASGSGTSYTATAGAAVTLSGAGTSGTYDRLDWRDAADGATASGTTWTPALAVGSHTITLTASSSLFGPASTSVTIDVRPADTTAPTRHGHAVRPRPHHVAVCHGLRQRLLAVGNHRALQDVDRHVPRGAHAGPPLGIEAWAVVTNGAGVTFETEHYFLFT